MSPSDPSLSLSSTAAKSPFVIAIQVIYHANIASGPKKLIYTNRTPGSRSSLPLLMQPFSPAHGLPVQPIFLSRREPYTDWRPADMPLRSFSRLGKTASLGFAFCSVVLSLSCHLWPLPTEKRAKCLAIVSEYLEEICARL